MEVERGAQPLGELAIMSGPIEQSARLQVVILTGLLKEALQGCTQTQFHDWEIRAKKALRGITTGENPAAVALGRLGGSQRTSAQTKARKLNGKAPCGPGKKRGRPRKLPG